LSENGSDRELMARSRAGETEAFRTLFERKNRRVYLIAYQVLGNPSQAEEVVQDVFLALWQHLDRYRPRFAVDTWLTRIATNRAIDVWRSQRRERPTSDESGGMEGIDTAGNHAAGLSPGGESTAGGSSAGRQGEAGRNGGPEAVARGHEVQAIWNELADLLPPQQRAAFVLREIEEISTGEVASALGCSASTVRSHVAEARRTLQAALSERYPELLR
jgi:RNA polymerase sigma-70 factor (ECF subfamily)